MPKVCICEQCGKPTQAERSTKRFCSTLCRQAAQRGAPRKAHKSSARELVVELIEVNPALREQFVSFAKKHGSAALSDCVNLLAAAQESSLPKALRARLESKQSIMPLLI